MEEQSSLGQWLEQRCKRGHLSLREAATKTGLSHSTIRDLINGSQPSPETLRKLAHAFGGDGTNQQMALGDQLLVLAGYRMPRQGEEITQPMAQLMDKVRRLSEPQIKMMGRFADFLVEIKDKGDSNEREAG